jgi:hypothetical protein
MLRRMTVPMQVDPLTIWFPNEPAVQYHPDEYNRPRLAVPSSWDIVPNTAFISLIKCRICPDKLITSIVGAEYFNSLDQGPRIQKPSQRPQPMQGGSLGQYPFNVATISPNVPSETRDKPDSR